MKNKGKVFVEYGMFKFEGNIKHLKPVIMALKSHMLPLIKLHTEIVPKDLIQQQAITGDVVEENLVGYM